MNQLISTVIFIGFTLLLQISTDFYIVNELSSEALLKSTYYSFIHGIKEYGTLVFIATSLTFLSAIYFFFKKDENSIDNEK